MSDDAAGLALLRERLEAIPEALRRTVAAELPAFAPGAAEHVVTTGLGSSRAHARFFAHCLAEAGVDARFVASSALGAAPPADARKRLLVVFSQGLSPNACIPLAKPDAWGGAVVVTAATGTSSRDRGPRFRKLVESGVGVAGFAGEDEFGMLFRVIGPMCAYVAALRLARHLAAAQGRESAIPEADAETLIGAIAAARHRAPAFPAHALEQGVAVITSGGYGELADNLRLKLVEAMLLPEPPAWDVLDFAHGPFQQAYDRPLTLIALARRDAPAEPDLFARLRSMLVPERHRWLPLEATLPGPLALFEHESAMNELLLRFATERGLDPTQWPGQNLAGPLYTVDAIPGDSPAASSAKPPLALAEVTTWELDAAIATGRTTIVIPLGATEQHGDHLPLATDSTIAAEVARRFCHHVPEAFAAPVLPFGCSREHLAFRGTLSLAEETLERVLLDLLDSCRRHGFRRAFLFSAHGGNIAPLRAMLPRLRVQAAPLVVDAAVDLDALSHAGHDESLRAGITREASGHHAGEHETSILAGIDPGSVRRGRLAAGFVEPVEDAQALFYPSLRDRVPSGVVGDPRGADGRRASAYLDAWVTLLVASYRRPGEAPPQPPFGQPLPNGGR